MSKKDSASLQTVTEPQLQRRLDGLTRLLEVTRSLAEQIDLEQTLTTIISEACRALNCDRASLFQFDSQRNELYTSVVTELEIGEIRKSLDSGITGWVARRQMIANIPDPSQDARWDAGVDRATGYQTRNILAAPLTSPHDGGLLGVIQLLNKHEGSFDDTDEELLQAFSQHAAVALDRAQLVSRLQEQKQVETSLNVARDIQRGFMPNVLPDVPGYELASWWYPNEAIGGDYCDVIRLGDSRTGLCVADVSGHGLGPALIMASVRAALRALVLEHNHPQELLERLGKSMEDDLQHGRFITMVVAVLDHVSHDVEFSNAGHSPSLHFEATTNQFTSMESTGVPLGVLDNPDYPAGPRMRINVGDMLILCTDGIVEAMDEHDRQFGLGRLKELICQNCSDTVENIVQIVGREIEEHYVGDAPPDDLTILAARRNA